MPKYYVVKSTLWSLILTLGMSYSVNAANEILDDGLGFSPKNEVNYFTQRVVNELVSRNDALRPDQPLVVSTPVLLGDFGQSNALAAQLQQGMMAAFHLHQFNVVDLNVADSLRVTADGDFILSRDWQQLPTGLPVEHLVVSTMSLTPTGMAFNSRIVDVTNNRVVSAMHSFVSAEQLPTYLVKSDKVVSKEGVLYRYQNTGEESVTVVGDKQ